MVYVDDIVITGNDTIRISQLREHLFNHFLTYDLGFFKYFWVSKRLNQRKVLSFHEENVLSKFKRLVNCKLIDSPTDPNQKLMMDQGETFSDPKNIWVGCLADKRLALGFLNQGLEFNPQLGHGVKVLWHYFTSKIN